MVTLFKYLERILTSLDDNCPAVVADPQKA